MPDLPSSNDERIAKLEHELAQTRTALLIYGQHLPICGTLTAAECDCTWADWQRNLETEGRC